jgi:hypothetical protein
MLEFLHDGEMAVKLMLKIRRPESYCPELTDLYWDLKDISDRASKICDVRLVRGDTMLILQERLYFVYSILHLRADLSKLFFARRPPHDYDEVLDALTYGSFLQQKMFTEMTGGQADELYTKSSRNDSVFQRYQEFKHGAPMMQPRNQIINAEFVGKLQRYMDEVDLEYERTLISYMESPLPAMGRGWFPLRRYSSAPVRGREYMSLDVSGANLNEYNGLLSELRELLMARCGLDDGRTSNSF